MRLAPLHASSQLLRTPCIFVFPLRAHRVLPAVRGTYGGPMDGLSVLGSKRQRDETSPSHSRKQPCVAAPAAGNNAPSSADNSPWLIVGLGNPGANYESTRHNVGFMVVDALSSSEGIDCRKLEKGAAVGRGQIQGVPVILAKPCTFMNNSGEAVAALAGFYKVPSQRILVISDDLDIDHAVLRLRAKGGHGGHNGLRSIIQRLGGTQDFPRLKLGIGRPPGQMAVATWVLQDFSAKEQEQMAVSVQLACDAVRSILSKGLEKTLSIVHPPAPKPAPKPKAVTEPTNPPRSTAAATAVRSGVAAVENIAAPAVHS